MTFLKIEENNLYFKKSYIEKQYHDLRIYHLGGVFVHQGFITTGTDRSLLRLDLCQTLNQKTC